MQRDVMLFDGTVRESIGHGRQGATAGETEDAAAGRMHASSLCNCPRGTTLWSGSEA